MSKKQGGQSAIVIIFIILIGGLLLLQFIQKTPSEKLSEPVCVNSPDSGITAKFNGDTYERIRGVTAIPYGELSVHLEIKGKAETITYGEKDAYTAVMDGNNPKSVTFDIGAKNLLFVEVSDLVKDKMIGYQYFEIYLKKGENIPDFVKDFCKSNQPLSPRTILSDSSGNSFPPISFMSNQIQPNPISDNTKYYLFSYEGKGSKSWDITVEDTRIKGSISIASNGITKTYTTYYNSGSSIKYIALIDNDPASINSQVAYKYSPMQFLSPYSSPVPTSSFGARNSLQLRTFSNLVVYPWGWWSPECKPAIYLYPTEKTNVSVRVQPAGFLTYTNPKYPDNGWQVVAHPDGKIDSDGKIYDYLYYESKIKDSEINKPQDGFVIAFNDLSAFYSKILPKLGLNEKETKDFKTYWEKYLPTSPYYFVGLMDEQSIEKIEPLSINPKPESIIRVRFYFKALDKKISVKEPTIIAPRRTGYTLVEWGGLVKTDLNHPFTCSQ